MRLRRRAARDAVRPGDGGAGDPEFRQPMAEGVLPAAHPVFRRLVGAGLYRARLGFGPGFAQVQGRARGRLLHCQRSEDLDHARPARRHDFLPGAHRLHGEKAGRHLLPPHRHAFPRHQRATHHTLDEEHEVNVTFFDSVKVPAKNLVGEEGKGWTYAKFLLGHERTGIARVGESKRELEQLKKIATKQLRNGKPLMDDPRFRDRVTQVEVELMALEITLLRVLSSRTKPGPEASILKIKGTDVQQALTELTMEAMGPYALPFRPETRDAAWHGEPVGPEYAGSAAAVYFNYRKTSIYGGSNEIQRNIISQMVLGL